MKLLRVLDQHTAMFGPHDALGTIRHQLGLITAQRQIALARPCEWSGWTANPNRSVSFLPACLLWVRKRELRATNVCVRPTVDVQVVCPGRRPPKLAK